MGNTYTLETDASPTFPAGPGGTIMVEYTTTGNPAGTLIALMHNGRPVQERAIESEEKKSGRVEFFTDDLLPGEHYSFVWRTVGTFFTTTHAVSKDLLAEELEVAKCCSRPADANLRQKLARSMSDNAALKAELKALRRKISGLESTHSSQEGDVKVKKEPGMEEEVIDVEEAVALREENRTLKRRLSQVDEIIAGAFPEAKRAKVET